VAGGLDAERQRLLAESWLEPLSQPGANPGELIRLAAALERIDPAQKQLLDVYSAVFRKVQDE
jgi:hypothetical protein